jgi:hypothetical protein
MTINLFRETAINNIQEKQNGLKWFPLQRRWTGLLAIVEFPVFGPQYDRSGWKKE